MIEQERACCEFLSFTVQEKPDAIIVTVIAPKEARGHRRHAVRAIHRWSVFT